MSDRLCIQCMHCYLTFSSDYICHSPQNSAGHNTCPVTGSKTERRKIDGDCFSLRNAEEGCGPNGKWWEKGPMKRYEAPEYVQVVSPKQRAFWRLK